MPDGGQGDLTHRQWTRLKPLLPGRGRPGVRWSWSADGTWDKILRFLLAHADVEGRIDWSVISVDSTSCRAYQHAAGGRTTPPRPRAPGRSQSASPRRGTRAFPGRPDEQDSRISGRDQRYDKRAYVFHGIVTVAAIRLWLRP